MLKRTLQALVMVLYGGWLALLVYVFALNHSNHSALDPMQLRWLLLPALAAAGIAWQQGWRQMTLAIVLAGGLLLATLWLLTHYQLMLGYENWLNQGQPARPAWSTPG